MADISLPLALLYTDGRREIRGATKLQKLAFLAQEEKGVDELHEFEPHKYGPFSPTLAAVVKTLREKGMVEKEDKQTERGNELSVYSLTDDGVDLAQTLLHEREENVEGTFESAEEIKKEKNNTKLDSLLRYVYKKYPEYTSESELELAEEV